ncbi:MAG: hypothetical protein A3F09_03470 [Chlamydiae bacterium RIFCSPHIGHO2_12_FULL_49_11]|nr:MAG: hypothetical protein A3F09_03470 [Chlamydiae bacterium RIFCSPHIGHO2_12_FULL_49_11]
MKKTFIFLALSFSSYLGADIYEEFARLTKSYELGEWPRLLEAGEQFLAEHKNSEYASKVHFYVAKSHFFARDYDFANEEAGESLRMLNNEQFFEEVVALKFQCAEKLREGAYIHPFGVKSTPRIVSGKDLALSIYEEILQISPKSDIGSRSLFHKGEILAEFGRHEDAVADYQTLVRRFPSSALVGDAYVNIVSSYYDLSRGHNPDTDYLELARIELRQFQRNYPLSPKLVAAEKLYHYIEDVYALDLFKSATYYEKKKKIASARMYYEKLLAQFPESSVAPKAQSGLARCSKNTK